MSLPELMSDIYEALQPISDEIEGLQVFPFWEDTPTPPAIDFYPSTPFQIGAGFGIEQVQVFLTVRARALMADPESGQTVLLRLLDPTDPASVEKALSGIDVVVPTDGIVSGFTQYADDAPVNERLLGCEWRVSRFL